MEGWRTTTIDAACNIEYGTRVVQKRDGGSIYPVYGGGGATFFMDTSNRVNRVVVSRFGMSELCTRYVDGQFFLNDSGLTLSPKDSKVLLPEFLDRVALALNDEIFALGKGAAQKNLDVPAFRGLSFSYPESIPEQRRIVAILDEAFEGIATAKANAEKNLRNAREVFATHHQAVFSGMGVTVGNARLGNIASFRNGINYTRQSKGRTVRIIGVKDFQDHFWAPLDDLDAVTLDGDLSHADAVTEGDILTVRSNGNPELIGRCMIVGELTDPVTHSGFTIRIAIDRNIAIPAYVCQFLKSRAVRRKLIDGGNGLNIKSLNQGMLAEIVVPVPTLAKQREIAADIEAMTVQTAQLTEIAQRKLATLAELKRSLLHQAFSGGLS